MTGPRNRALLGVFGAGLSAVLACAAPDAVVADSSDQPVAAGDLAGFEQGQALLQGFDPVTSEGELRAGDAVLFGLRLLDGDTRKTWFLLVTAAEDEAQASDGLGLRVRVCGEDARTLAEVPVGVTPYLLGGAARACNPEGRAEPPAEFPMLGVRGGATVAVMDLVRIVENTPALQDILWQVVRRPSLWSLIGGVRVSAGMDFTRARATGNPLPGATARPAWAFPLQLRLNNQTALLCTVTAVDPWPPVRVCGGLVALNGHAADDPGRRLVLRLLAARRGAAP